MDDGVNIVPVIGKDLRFIYSTQLTRELYVEMQKKLWTATIRFKRTVLKKKQRLRREENLENINSTKTGAADA